MSWRGVGSLYVGFPPKMRLFASRWPPINEDHCRQVSQFQVERLDMFKHQIFLRIKATSQNIVKLPRSFVATIPRLPPLSTWTIPSPSQSSGRDAVIDKARQCPRIVNTQGRAVSAAAHRPSRVSVAGWIIFLTDKIRSAPRQAPPPGPGASHRAAEFKNLALCVWHRMGSGRGDPAQRLVAV